MTSRQWETENAIYTHLEMCYVAFKIGSTKFFVAMAL